MCGGPAISLDAISELWFTNGVEARSTEEETMVTKNDARTAQESATRLVGVRDDLRAAVSQVDDIQLKAVLETGAEVVGGLRQAFVDYGEGDEEAWQR